MICALSLVLVLAVLQGGNGLTDEEKSQIVARHNQYRNEVQPPAANMLAMQWNDELAKDAQSMTDQCDLNIRSQGISFDATKKTRTNLDFFMDSWNGVKTTYDFVNNTCAYLNFCYRYTQMVWATTSLVGCGMTECGEDTNFKGELFACMYGPSVHGTLRPYESGWPCSNCPDSEGVAYSCEDNLCTLD